MMRGRLTPWLLGAVLALAGCGGAPKGEAGNGFTQSSSSKSNRRVAAGARASKDPTRRTYAGYHSTPDFGTMQGRRFEDMIPVGARITAVNVAVDDGVKAIWLSYELDGVKHDTPRRGGDGGVTKVLKLQKNEKLVAIDGDGRDCIDQLTIVTNDRVKTFGDGGSMGDATSWLTAKQEKQYLGIGIGGRADDKVRQLSFRFQVR